MFFLQLNVMDAGQGVIVQGNVSKMENDIGKVLWVIFYSFAFQ